MNRIIYLECIVLKHIEKMPLNLNSDPTYKVSKQGKHL